MDFTDLYIDGQWRATTERFDVINPATEEVLASVASAEIADADAALDAAEAAMAEWAARTPRERSEVLRKAWELMTVRLEDFAKLITLENGKARADAMGEAAYAAEFFRWFAEEARRIYGDVIPGHGKDKRIVVIKQPVGVVAAITPFNDPLNLVAHKLGPAIAAGIIAAPSQGTPRRPARPVAEAPLGRLPALQDRHRRATHPATPRDPPV